MQTRLFRIWTIYMSVSFFIIMSGCKPLSENRKGNDNKMNGGFEIVKNNLPVNWWFYSPKSVPNGDFDISIDTTKFKEGKQSLKFMVRECSPLGGWRSPGFFEDFNANPGETYKVSFWVMSEGCSFQVIIESSEKGKPEFGRKETILNTVENIPDWKYYEYMFKVPSELKIIRFEANIYKPGIIWFDGIQIIGTENDKGERTIR